MILIEILDGISIEGPVGNGVLDVPYSATLTARNGTLPVVWEVDGLPDDFDWTDNEDGTVTISSDAETVEVIEATVTATDADGVYTTRALNFRIIALPLIVTGTLADGTVGEAYATTLAISGGYQPYASAQVIEGPTGMTAAIDGDTVAVGGPITEAGDAQEVRIRVTDDENNTADFVGTIDVAYATAAIVGDFADGEVGEAYESDLQLTGGNGTWSLTGGDGVASGALPAGTALSIVEVSGTHYLRLSGMPIAVFDDSFTVSVDSGDGQTATSEQAMEVRSAYPQIASITISEFDLPATSHAVEMPATVDSGDLLLVLLGTDGGSTDAVTTPDGWASVFTRHNIDTSNRISIFQRLAAGGEGGTTVDFATPSDEEAAAVVLRLAAGSFGAGIEVESSAFGGSGGDAPTLSPTWGSAATLWLTVLATGRLGSGITFPLSQNQTVAQGFSGSGAGSTVAMCTAEATTDTFAPGFWFQSDGANQLALTIGVQPA